MKNKILVILNISILFICCFTACSDDDNKSYLPITLTLVSENEELSLDNFRVSMIVSEKTIELKIKGGDGNYTLNNDNKTVLDTKYSDNTITLKALNNGITNITITDKAENSCILIVETLLSKTSVSTTVSIITGDNLTTEEKISLEKEILESSPSGYDFTEDMIRVFSQEPNGTDYKDYDFVQQGKLPESLHPTFELQIYYWFLMSSGNEETALFLTRYVKPNRSSELTRLSVGFNSSIVLDVTADYKSKYPALERAYAVQAFSYKNN